MDERADPLSRRALLVVAAIAGTVFVVAAAVVATAGDVPGDEAAVRETVASVDTALDTPARVVGLSATAWVLVPVAVLLVAWCVVARARRTLGLVLAVAATVWLVNPGLKRVFTRDRPSVRELIEPTSRFTFPAGHAVAAAAFGTLAVVLAWPTRWRTPVVAGVVVWVLLVGLSRLGLGVHYPSDLLAGGALGVAVTAGVAAFTVPARG